MAKLVPASLSGRLFLVSMLVVTLFLPLAGLVLERAYSRSLDQRLEEQLKIQLYGLMGLADELNPGTIWLPESLPDNRFNQIGSGRYAVIMDSRGNPIWRSQSAINLQFPNPVPDVLGEITLEDINPPGVFISEVVKLDDVPLMQSSRVTVIWEGADNTENLYTFLVAESLTSYSLEKQVYRETLIFWLGGLGLFLISIDAIALVIALRPLKRLAHEIQRVEAGEIAVLNSDYPTELNHVALNLNTLIRHEQEQRERYRNTLQDLAHSLKTPLSVVQVSISHVKELSIKESIAEQITRMSDIVSYQLQRAVSSGNSLIHQKVNVRESILRVTSALSKVYKDKNIEFSLEVPESCEFFGDDNDLLEIIGNLCDNACKYGNGTVKIVANETNCANNPLKTMLKICVIDNGEGVDHSVKEDIFKRGQRLDEQVEGQGIGLSVVYDIVQSYQGTIGMDQSPDGFNRVIVQLPGRMSA